MNKTPISIIIDDSTPLVHVYYHHMPKPITRDGRPIPENVPNSFMKKFCNIVTENGVKGKFSIVPAPAALGDVANGIEGFPKETTDEWLNMAKETLSVNFSFGPEMLTHAHVIDIETREDLGEYEHRWSQKQNKEVLIPYISKAFSLLKEAGINATGVTSPWDFGEQILEDYEEAVSVSMKNVYGRNECWYFLHMHFDTPNAKPWLAVNKEGRKLVSVPGTINDFFWPTIDNTDTSDEYINSIADKYITEDGKSGKIIEALENGSYPILTIHWQSLFSSGLETGIAAFEKVVKRVNSLLGDKCIWKNFEELMTDCISENPN